MLQVLLYYLFLAGALAVVYQFEPNLQGVFSLARFRQAMESGAAGLTGGGGGATEHLELSPGEMLLETVITMFGAVLLMLPVAWVYIMTRSKKGFSQSTVQTLIFLPIVVTGVVMLVRSSVALAFGLGGVVGAVAFRNRLQDPKDAIYIFLAIAVGLASGVQVMPVALAISAFFNLIVLVAWQVDFGRMPGGLEAGVAERRLQRLRAAPSAGGGEFMSVLDQQLLKSMTPDQLQALAQRASERSQKVERSIVDSGSITDTAEQKIPKPKFDHHLRIVMQPDDAVAVRQAVEGVLESQVKRWEFDKAGPADGGRASALYRVRFKKTVPNTLVVEAIRRAVLPRIVTIDVRSLTGA
ncbi:MAG TPA: DUF4956 domain-containing protein [Gemmatimonadales bacterium]|nr:DUF4956 domain-containing protein [Gemmatimonadales bacterium]